MKIRLPKKRRYRISLYILSALIILLAIDLLLIRLGRHITVSPEITHITSPLKPDGMPDYVKYIDDHASAGLTPDNNAAVLLQQAFGPPSAHPEAIAPIYSRLALSPPPSNDTTQYFISYNQYTKDQNLDPDPDYSFTRPHPWTAAEYPALAACIEKNARPFDLLHQAVQRPRYFFPMVSSPGHEEVISFLLLQINPIKKLGELTIARAMLRAAEGDFDHAHADLLATHKIARLLSQQPTFTEFVIAAGLEVAACQGDQAIATAKGLTIAQARSFLADLLNLPPLPPITNIIDKGERLFGLDTCIFAAHIGLPQTVRVIFSQDLHQFPTLSNMFAIYLLPANFNDAMRAANQFYDRLTAASQAPSFSQSISAARKLESDAVLLRDTANPAKTVLSCLIPGLTQLFSHPAIAHMQLDLSRLSLALAAYHADHQSYPDSLAPLSPAYLPTIPNDLFIDAPLHYTPSPAVGGKEQGYLLYSVGPNMKDDQAHNPSHADSQSPNADDLIVDTGPVATSAPTTRP